MSKYILLLLFAFLIGQFIVRFVLPIFRATAAMQQKVNQMNRERQKQEQQGYQNANQFNQATQEKKAEPIRQKEGEYIDFEEVK